MTDQTVVLTPGTNPNGGFEWQMGLNGNSPAGPPYPPIKVNPGDSPYITFNLQNAPGVSFTANSFMIPSEVNGVHVKSVTPTQLKIHDKNLDKADVPYVIMFSGSPVKLDPIIQNDGGGRMSFSDYKANSTAMLIAGAVIGAILVLVVRAIFSKRGPVER